MAKAPYDIHLFVCTNERSNGKACCGQSHGLKLTKALKESIAHAQLPYRIRVNKAGCLDVCAYGPAMVIYPQGIWYGGVTLKHVEAIVEGLANGQPMAPLQIDFKQPARKWLKNRKSMP